MKEIWEQAILSYNLPLTVALGLVIVFWILAVIGTIDFESLDFDFDFDADVDADLDADLDTDVTPGSGGFMMTILKFVNATDVPVMMVLSFLTLFMWTFAIISNAAFNPNHSWLIASGLIVGNFFLSCLMVKITTQPFRPFFNAFKKGENDDEPVIGRVGTVKSRVIDTKYGQVEIPRDNGAPAIVNCRMADDHESMVRGDQVLVFSKDKEKNLFLVRSATPSQEKQESTEKQTTQHQTTTSQPSQLENHE
ncbi:DUF1449 family protein [Verrucomicrobiaceae bacterium N1E253]|uniref:DUF1449 family protein n=1 Tax=Oceaniferula marina TaxID=2748318 RepID=A0A851GP85_9BACT|nr:OB-fold-containig protein [Oceaniferula marina]NWK55954.1 DUF1449 family protein [Oceaniferula marina]